MLNKQGEGKISWTDFSWNPIQAKCLHDCSYCYMKKINKRFNRKFNIPKFNLNYLKDLESKKLKKGDKIFVGSSTDMFGDWIEKGFIDMILQAIDSKPDLIFQFLTKNPKRYAEFEFPKNCLKGMTVDTNKRFLKYETDCLPISFCDVNFVSFEPLLEEISSHTLRVFEYFNIDWVIIGGESGGTKKPDEWADKIIEIANYVGIPVWVKENYKYGKIIKEWPIIKNN